MNGMESGRTIAQIIGLLLALFLAVRAIRGRDMPARRTAGLAAIWVAIIVGLTVALTLLMPR